MIVNHGGTNQSFVDEHIKQAQIIRVQNNVDNLQALRQKTADMMVTDLIEGDYYQSKEPGVFCVANETPFAGTASNKVYMMSKDNPALLKKVNQWLDSQRFSNGSGKFAVNRGGAPPPADTPGGGYRPRLALRRAPVAPDRESSRRSRGWRSGTAYSQTTRCLPRPYFYHPGVVLFQHGVPQAVHAKQPREDQNRQQAANHHPVRGAGILRQLRQGLTQMAQRQQQRPRGGQQGKPHPAAVESKSNRPSSSRISMARKKPPMRILL